MKTAYKDWFEGLPPVDSRDVRAKKFKRKMIGFVNNPMG
jgi:hypothetical protein